MALYLDSGSVEAGVEVSEPFAGNDLVHFFQWPAGRVATTAYFGSYRRLSEAHSGIRQWCGAHCHRLSNPRWEICGHWDESWNADASKVRTDIFHLLEDQKD